MDRYVEVNRRAWDKRTLVHLRSSFYDVEGFLHGGLSLKPIERNLVGDVRGLRLLHLQCHFGLDTLSWVRLGAVVTGVDVSEVSIAKARELSVQSGLPATFLCHDVQRLGDSLRGEFDVIVSSYGVLPWLGDLKAWAEGIGASLRPGGRFVLVEFHPILDVIFDGKVSGSTDYFGGSVIESESTGSYADPSADIRYRECRWQHPVSEVVGALLQAGLTLKQLDEYPFSSYELFEGLDTCSEGVWIASEAPKHLPFMYSVIAELPEHADSRKW